MRTKMKRMVNKINIIHHICDMLASNKHKTYHRLIVGIGVMVVGVMIAKTIGHNPTHYIAIIGDTIGYGLHGIGLVPFVETLLEEVE